MEVKGDPLLCPPCAGGEVPMTLCSLCKASAARLQPWTVIHKGLPRDVELDALAGPPQAPEPWVHRVNRPRVPVCLSYACPGKYLLIRRMTGAL